MSNKPKITRKAKKGGTEKSDNIQTQNKPWLFKPGVSGNPLGKPVGTRDFKTVFREAIIKIAKHKGKKINPEQAELILASVGFDKAKRGNYKFWESVTDRLYGKPTQPVELNTYMGMTREELEQMIADKLTSEE